MFSVYFHIPYCRKACHYCDFHFSTQLQSVDKMVEAMMQELALRAPEWQGLGAPETVYFGGGTPSLLRADQIETLLQRTASLFPSGSFREVTLEANPEDMTFDKLRAWGDAGITRLSIGVQTFQDPLLKWMGRTHTGADAIHAIERAAHIGFNRMTLDLMYGLPGRKPEAWTEDVDRALGLPIDHLSAYLLTVEPNTVLGAQVKRGLEKEVDEQEVGLAYGHLCMAIANQGWEHYEVSNFCKPGGRALHNSKYWEGLPYLGIGPGAHGFNGTDRYANVSNNPNYLRALSSAQGPLDLPATWDRLSPNDRYNETLMTGLRTSRGIDLNALDSRFGKRPDVAEPRNWQNRVGLGQLVPQSNGYWRIAEAHWLVGDAIASDFFWVED